MTARTVAQRAHGLESWQYPIRDDDQQVIHGLLACYDVVVALTAFALEHHHAPAIDHPLWRDIWAARAEAEKELDT